MDLLDRFIIFISCVMEVFILYDYFKNFFAVRARWNKKEILVICIVVCLSLFGINLLENGYLNLIAAPIILWFMVLSLFEGSLGSRIGYFVLAYVVMLGVEGLYGIISQIALSKLKSATVIEVSEYTWQFLFVKLLNYVIFAVIKQLSGKGKRYMTNKYFGMYLCLPIATLGCMITVFYSGIDFSKNITQKILMTTFFVLMIFGNMLIFYAFQKYTEGVEENLQQQHLLDRYKKELNYLSRIGEINAGNRELMHDIKHYIKVLGNMAQEENSENISRIIAELGGKIEKNAMRTYSSNMILNTLLSEYQTDAKKEGINYKVYVEPGVSLNTIKDIDLIAILANLLDNALTAAMKKGEKAGIETKIFRNAGNYIIKVENDFAEKLRMVEGKLMSTKTDGGIHGVGMDSVKHTVESYGGDMEYYVEGEKFTAVVTLPE